jgi:hypothetical protein
LSRPDYDHAVDVYLEAGRKRVFAAAVDWPGWARAGKTEQEALAALVAYGPRYRTALGKAAANLEPPASVGDLNVVARLAGDATTDFGAPGGIPTLDLRPTDADGMDRLVHLLRAAWAAFDRAAAAAGGRALAKGPRGGGRSLARIREHVFDADRGYLNALGAKPPPEGDRVAVQQAYVDGLRARARGELPETGPRGGRRWPAPYAVRRSAWHALDHAWEIEDRAGQVAR